jgi:hypothetical protein
MKSMIENGKEIINAHNPRVHLIMALALFYSKINPTEK